MSRSKQTIPDFHIRGLVIEGGGAKGVAYGGCLLALEEFDILEKITHLAGTSAGAIVSALLAIGYNAREISDIMFHLDFRRFKDDDWGVFRDSTRLATEFGWFRGSAFRAWFEERVRRKTGNAQYTFRQLWEDRKKVLVVTGTNLTKMETVYFSHETYPDMPICLAVRISISLPFAFASVKMDGHIYVDGGLAQNYPLAALAGRKDIHPTEIWGLKLMGQDETVNAETKVIEYKERKITSFLEFTGAFVDFLTLSIERQQILNDPSYFERTIRVDTFDVDTMDFSMDVNTKGKLVQHNYTKTANFLRELMCKLESSSASPLKSED